jgi:hypothetical protein
MAITFRSVSALVKQVTTGTIVVTKPAGVVDGDVMITVHIKEGGGGWTITPPAGWTLIQGPDSTTSDGQELVAYKKVASSEGASYSWSHDANNRTLSFAVAYSGVDNTTPININGVTIDSGANASPVSVSSPAETTTQNGCMLLHVAAGDPTNSGGSWTAPAGFTARVNDFDTGSPMDGFVPVLLADKIQSSAGSTGTLTSTLTLSGGDAGWIAQTIALQDASPPAGGAFPPVPEPPFVHANLMPILAR